MMWGCVSASWPTWPRAARPAEQLRSSCVLGGARDSVVQQQRVALHVTCSCCAALRLLRALPRVAPAVPRGAAHLQAREPAALVQLRGREPLIHRQHARGQRQRDAPHARRVAPRRVVQLVRRAPLRACGERDASGHARGDEPRPAAAACSLLAARRASKPSQCSSAIAACASSTLPGGVAQAMRRTSPMASSASSERPQWSVTDSVSAAADASSSSHSPPGAMCATERSVAGDARRSAACARNVRPHTPAPRARAAIRAAAAVATPESM